MIKRISTIFLSVLATMVLLAHTVIPHHHHRVEICAEITHCDSEKELRCETDGNAYHEHDSNSDNVYCVLNQSVIVPTNDLRFKSSNNQKAKSHLHLKVFNSVSSTNLLINKCQTNSLIAQQSAPARYYSLFVVSGLGLRAPPTV